MPLAPLALGLRRPVPGKTLDFNGKTVLITGASSGIGRACAIALGNAGARLLLSGRRAEALRSVADEAVGAAVLPSVFPADLTNSESLAALCDQVLSATDRLDLIIHSAGVGMYVPSYESSPENVRYVMELNFLAPVEITRRLHHLVPSGGTIVTISSIGGKISLPWLNIYSASKYALNAFSDGLRMELAERSVHVLNVCPCYVDTPFQSNVIQGRVPQNLVGNRRFTVSPEQCAEAILKAIKAKKRVIVTPKIAWVFVLLARLFPAAVHARMAKYKPREGPATKSVDLD